MTGGFAAGIRQLCTATTLEDGLNAVVAAADGLLDADVCEFLVEQGDRLAVRASTAGADAGGSYPRWTGIPGGAYTANRTCVIDDCLDTRSAAEPQGAAAADPPRHRSLCCVPVAGYGLLLAKAVSPAAFTETDRALADRFGTAAEVALAGIEAEAGQALSDGGGSVRDESCPETLEKIADILSHDLRSPLTVAIGSLELARESGDEEDFDRVARALGRIEELVEETVLLARTGELVGSTWATVDLRSVAEQTWTNVHGPEAALEIEDTVEFEANERAIRHVLENLMENAIEHAGPSVAIRIGSTAEGFFVEDDGPGIPDEHREAVFDRGFAIAGDSSGIGLHIVQRIVEAHGWAIRAEPAPTGGVRFAVTGVDTTPD